MPGVPQTLPVPPKVNEMTMLNAIRLAAGGGPSGGTGTVTSVSVATANGVSGVVATPNTTPDITFTLGAITPTSVNALTFAAAAVGFTIAGGTTSKTLTVLDTGTAALLGIAQTFSAANIFSANGAASTPAITLTGTVFTGGTATSTKPLFLIEPAGTTSNGWSTNGTMLGVNAPSGFSGDILRACLNGSTAAAFRVYLDVSSTIFIGPPGAGIAMYGNLYPEVADSMGLGRPGVSSWSGLYLTPAAPVSWNSDTGIARSSAGVVRVTNGGAGYGDIDASGYRASGTAGVTAGPYTVITSITVKNGLVTAIAGS